MKQTAVPLLVHLYSWLLRLYPSGFRDEFGEEMTAVFTQALSHTQKQGWLPLLIWCGREFTSLFAALIREQWLSWHREDAVMNPTNSVNHTLDMLNTDQSERETPLAILTGILPFVLIGLMYVLKGVNYHAPLAWMGGRGTSGIHGYLGFIVLGLALIGLGIGWARRFPRWSYAYLGLTVMESVLLADTATPGFRLFGHTFGRELWGWRGWLPLLLLTAVMLLLTRSLQPMAQLIQSIRRDWTRFSFAIYAALAWLFMGVAYDGKTWYNQTFYLPLNLFLIALAMTVGAFFYMRERRQWPRVLALQIGLILHMPISALVTALDGSSESGASPTAVGWLILPLAWFVWTSIPLWPGFASHMWQRFRPA
ncbi:MAG: hypothetical protein GY805_25760 [Chloroflexi bacterium]|nr:hypothetical protein [Chloroflexota bacterium]